MPISKITSETISAPPLRKAQSSPSIARQGELEIPSLPAELQQELAAMRGYTKPERWMCVVRREKINYAVGRIIQIGKVNDTSALYQKHGLIKLGWSRNSVQFRKIRKYNYSQVHNPSAPC
ncbi:hypothetical protein BYT27DRAFT_6636775 [Phlegmacium glaucopus]|nr:hypothetical protein BYT27DRAFT_6636775 [Phlegmacium glaucopus]